MKHVSSGPSGTKNDRAVSPVIAVILMVAITVVLAATVYVWVTQMGPSSQGPPGSLSVQQGTFNTTANACVTGSTWCVKWTVLGVSSDFKLSRLTVRDTTNDAGTITCTSTGTGAFLMAGDVLSCTGTSTKPTVGDSFLFVDNQAGSGLLSVSLHA